MIFYFAKRQCASVALCTLGLFIAYICHNVSGYSMPLAEDTLHHPDSDIFAGLIPELSDYSDPSNPYSREAYVTLVTTPQYIIGAEVLAKCLRHTNTERQFVALVGELVPEQGIYVLEDAGYTTIRVPSVPTKRKVNIMTAMHGRSVG
jgi:hypothetical protein